MLQSGPLEIRKTASFERWLRALRDSVARLRILARLLRLEDGHWGDARHIAGPLFELRIHVGPGYRIYVAKQDDRVVVVLGGGDKSSQDRDIERAVELVAGIRP